MLATAWRSLLRAKGRLILRLLGWRIEGGPPAVPKCVALGVPHTSNWDGVIMVAVAWVFGIRLRWIGKHTLFRGPLGPLMRALGGVPVDRRARQNLVQQLVAEFERHEQFILVVPPEGTRRRAPGWKTGFYFIALGAQVPLHLGFLDYRRKVAGFGPLFHPTGDLARDMEAFRRAYEGIEGKYPEQVSPVRCA